MVRQLTRRQRDDKAKAESSSLAWQVREFIRRHGQGEMTATAWLKVLNRQAVEAVRAASDFPKHPAQFGRRLRELTAGLSLLNVEVSSTRSGARGRLWKVETAEIAAARRHFAQTQAKREIMRKESERQERQLIHAARASLKPRRAPQRRKTS